MQPVAVWAAANLSPVYLTYPSLSASKNSVFLHAPGPFCLYASLPPCLSPSCMSIALSFHPPRRPLRIDASCLDEHAIDRANEKHDGPIGTMMSPGQDGETLTRPPARPLPSAPP